MEEAAEGRPQSGWRFDLPERRGPPFRTQEMLYVIADSLWAKWRRLMEADNGMRSVEKMRRKNRAGFTVRIHIAGLR
jgi:hypothetical protein